MCTSHFTIESFYAYFSTIGAMTDSNSTSFASASDKDVNGIKGRNGDGKLGGTVPSKLCFADGDKFEAKKFELEKAIKEVPVNQKKLRNAALSEGGLVADHIRRVAWPHLLELTNLSNPPMPDEDDLLRHEEYDQVVLDVNRSLKRFPPGIPLEQRLSLQKQLTRLILRVIITHPRLRYYQGYHDVAVTLLLVTGENAAFFILEKLSTNHLKDCMEPTMERTSYLLNYIYPLVERLNPNVYKYMRQAGLGTIFALPWFLTWYGHSLNQYKDIVRLYDYFLVSEPLIPLYLAAVIVNYRSKEILETPCNMGSLHQLLSQIPDNLPIEKLITQTTELYKKYPPQAIKKQVKEMMAEEQSRRQMEIAHQQRRMMRTAPLFWRWLNRFDPIRRLPLWNFPQPNIPIRFRGYRVIAATALAFGMWAYYIRAVDR